MTRILTLRRAACGVSLALLFAAPAAHASLTWYVDGMNAVCSDSATGSLADPYCSISAALAAHHDPGTTIQVLPGIYRERVLLPASGLQDQPIELRGMPGVIVDGTDDFSDADRWQQVLGGVWLAPAVNWNPSQVFVDSVRCKRWSGAPEDVPAGDFAYSPGAGLYLNIGGENPGLHEVLVGHRPYGFQMTNRAWIRIRDFTIAHADLKGVYMTLGSNHIEITGNTIRQPFRYGVQADTCSQVLIGGNLVTGGGDHGIVCNRGTTDSRIESNESAFNASPLTRQANGVYLFRAPGNVVLDNRCHDNQDTGIQIQSGSNGVVCAQNLSWGNGDHGFDNLFATGNLYVSNVSSGNFKDGFSFEGDATGNSLYDSIAIDNGLLTHEIDLWVDDDSMVGFHSDYNIFWNSTTEPVVKIGRQWFASVAQFSSQFGTDAHTFQLDPMFVAPRAGDFHLRSGSPAIDAANTSVPGWQTADADGNPRVNDSHAHDAGFGPVDYADRGAYEYADGDVATSGSIGPPPTLPAHILATQEGSVVLGFHPNPTRLSAAIGFRLARQERVRLLIVDPAGRVVRELLDGADLAAGDHSVTWNLTDPGGTRLHAGMYYYVLRTSAGGETGSFALLN